MTNQKNFNIYFSMEIPAVCVYYAVLVPCLLKLLCGIVDVTTSNDSRVAAQHYT